MVSLDRQRMNSPRIVVGLLGFAVFTYEGFRQMYRARHVDRLEREGKIPSDMAARIRKKPMTLIGWASIAGGVAVLVVSILGW